MFESLRSLSDHEVLSRTASLVAQERRLTLGLLLHLNEVERRKLHLKGGYSSMFAYCTTVLRYSSSAAMRRIRTARCVARFPRVYQLLESRDVNLSTVTQVSKVLTHANSDHILDRICGKSQREVEAIVAEFEPLAALPPERVRTVVVRVPIASVAENHNRTRRTDPESEAEARSPRAGIADAANQSLMLHTDEYNRNGCAADAVVGTTLQRRAVIQFSASESFMAKVKRIRSIASHRLPANSSLEQILDLALDLFIEREDPAERRERREKRKDAEKTHRPAGTAQPESCGCTRNIPARVRDDVVVRDKRQCTYVGANGQRCGSTHLLQIDHITPVARGGAATMDNLRLLCAHHNRLEAERLMGRSGPRHLAQGASEKISLGHAPGLVARTLTSIGRPGRATLSRSGRIVARKERQGDRNDEAGRGAATHDRHGRLP